MEYIHVKNYRSEFQYEEVDNRLVITPVVVDFVGNKHPAPYLEKYIQINYITQTLVKKVSSPGGIEVEIESEIVIFDRYYYRTRKEIVKYLYWLNVTSVSYFREQDFFSKLNLMNEYIAQGGDIRLIKLENFKRFSEKIENPINNIKELVAHLEIKYFEEFFVHAKKEDSCTIEAEILGLPRKDNYIINLIKKCIKELGYYYKDEYDQVVTLELDNYYCGDNIDLPEERVETDENYYIDYDLIRGLNKNYDKKEHLFQLLISDEKLWT